MQVASLCILSICVSNLHWRELIAGKLPYFPDNALELQLFELEQNILLQAQTLANKLCFSFKEKQCLGRNIG